MSRQASPAYLQHSFVYMLYFSFCLWESYHSGYRANVPFRLKQTQEYAVDKRTEIYTAAFFLQNFLTVIPEILL